ncbi:MAG TPA: ParB/RepB/Spo0J family partition protein [Egibacteraceae bacterium]|nr:ParB/RepB/Spo0J family partition protein [Egibacteraceae bacterium]
MSRPSGLGRGLGALIPSAGPGETGLINLRLSEVVPNPRQPRGAFDVDALEELAQSLREVGLLQPIIVRPVDDQRYEIVAGERRFRAARLAGLEEIPAVVRRTEDTQLLTEALVENIHRADLNPLEEAAAYQQLIDDFDVTHEALATKLGKSRSAISNALRLLTLPPSLQHKVAEGALSAGHARTLLPLGSAERQERLAQRIIAEGLSVRETEGLVRRSLEGPGESGAALSALAKAAKERRASPFEHLQATLGEALATRVTIKGSPRRGKVVIDYAGQEDLDRLLAVIARGTGADLGNG